MHTPIYTKIEFPTDRKTLPVCQRELREPQRISSTRVERTFISGWLGDAAADDDDNGGGATGRNPKQKGLQ